MAVNGGKAILGLGALGIAGALIYAATRKVEVAPPEEEGIADVIDATLEEGNVWWAGETVWHQVYTRWPNSWPADTDITFAWTIKNTGNVGAYFQPYMITPGEWLYLGPGNEIQVFESFHTPTIPVTPGYSYYRINILGRRITGERVGAVWASDEVEVNYV